MALDPAVAGLIDSLNDQGFRSFEQLGVDGTRVVMENFTDLQKPPQEVAEVIDVSYGQHPEQALRIFVPEGADPFPVLVYLHGGGFVGGNLAVVEEPARALANDLGAIVVAATYRRAPESRFPAAADDAFATLQWVAGHIAEHRGDPARLAIAGDSAGGNLAAVAANRAAEDGGPALCAQVLVYPLIDPTADTESRKLFSEGYIINMAALEWFGSQYVGAAEDVTDPRLAVNRSASLAGLPPTLILSNEYDPLRDEAEEFGAQLIESGVDAEVRRFDGLVHGVFWMSRAIPRHAEQHHAVVGFLSDRLAYPAHLTDDQPGGEQQRISRERLGRHGNTP